MYFKGEKFGDLAVDDHRSVAFGAMQRLQEMGVLHTEYAQMALAELR